MDAARIKAWGWYVLVFVFFAYVLSISTNFALNDPDIWWHLRTGKHIAETKSIPSEDPFSFTIPRVMAEHQKQGLRAHWLGQVMLYSAYKAGGLLGVGIFRGLLIVFSMLFTVVWLIEKGARPWAALSAVSFGAIVLTSELFYSFERPQGISFMLAPLLVILLEELKLGNRKAFIALPLLMALWSNIHGGFIAGNVIIMIYAAAEGATWLAGRLRGRDYGQNALRLFLTGSALGILASGLNPNKFTLFYNYLKGLTSMFARDVASAITRTASTSWVEHVVLEYKPLAYFYSELFYKWLIFYWVFTGLLLVLLAIKYFMRKKIDLAELLVVCFVSFFANYYARGLMFSIVILSFYYGKSLLELGEYKRKIVSAAFSGLIPAVFSLFVVALAAGFFQNKYRTFPWAMKPGVTKQWVSPWYPIGAVEFLKRERPAPPMYNFYTWGGFLTWYLYPDYRVFVDGRALDDMINRSADAILKAQPTWRKELDAFRVNFILVPVVFRESGHTVPIALEMVNNSEWEVIYLANNNAVFVRNADANKDIIGRYRIDKKEIFEEIIKIENILLISDPNNPNYKMGKAYALNALGRHEEARAIYNELWGPGSAPPAR